MSKKTWHSTRQRIGLAIMKFGRMVAHGGHPHLWVVRYRDDWTSYRCVKCDMRISPGAMVNSLVTGRCSK